MRFTTPQFSGRGSPPAIGILSAGYGLSALAPAKLAGAQRLCALAHRYPRRLSGFGALRTTLQASFLGASTKSCLGSSLDRQKAGGCLPRFQSLQKLLCEGSSPGAYIALRSTVPLRGKRTSTGTQKRLRRSKMTHLGPSADVLPFGVLRDSYRSWKLAA